MSGVTVNYNALPHLLTCIRSMRAEGIEDIVVADNASTDGAEAAVAVADPAVTYVQTGRNLGYGGGCNRAVAHTDPTTELILCINPDAWLEPGALEAMVRAFDGRPRLGIVGPRTNNLDGSRYPSVREFPSLVDSVGHAVLGMVWAGNPFTRRYRMLDRDLDGAAAASSAATDVDWVSGSGFLIRRACWDDIGGFDERYFMYAEDMDLCWRARRAGWEVAYEPSAVVVHVQGASTDQRPYRMIVAHHRALFRFAARSSTGVQRLLLPVMAVGLVFRTPLAWLHRALRQPAVK